MTQKGFCNKDERSLVVINFNIAGYDIGCFKFQVMMSGPRRERATDSFYQQKPFRVTPCKQLVLRV